MSLVFREKNITDIKRQNNTIKLRKKKKLKKKFFYLFKESPFKCLKYETSHSTCLET